jgi:peptidoglycan/LPS O-acetylase OafA/YrhL
MELRDNANQSHRFAFIDYLKVIATFTVVIAHEFQTERDQAFSKGILRAKLFDPIQHFLTTGGGGVILFFMISGFLITKASMRETARQFLVRRSMRILPLYWLAIIILLLSGRLKPITTELLGAFSLLGDFWSSEHVLGGVDWTLRLEILFYIFAAIFLYRLVNLTQKLPGKLALTVLPIFLLAIPNYPDGWSRGYAAIFLPMFVPGIAAAIYDINKNKLFLLLSVSIAYIVSLANMFRYRYDLRDEGFITYSFIALFLFLISYLNRENIPEFRTVKALANISYPIYLSHKYLIDDFGQIMDWLKESVDSKHFRLFLDYQFSDVSIQKCFALVFTLGSCWVASVLIEQPCIRISRRWSLRLKTN